MSKIMVYAQGREALMELVTGAYALSKEIPDAIVIDNGALAAEMAEFGSNVLHLKAGGEMVEEYVDTIAGLVVQYAPTGLLFDNSPASRVISGRLAARFGLSVQSDAKSMDENFVTTHLVYGGSAVRTNKSGKEKFIAVFAPNSFEPNPTGKPGSVVEIDFLAPKWRIKRIESRKKEASTVQLSSAKKVVGIGRGITKKEDIAMIEELACLLGAEVGCSRPLSEGLDWMPRERYIGLSNVFIKPDLYLAIGISGQVQHMVGVTESKTIVAINKNPDCPMIANSDYYAAGDLYEVVPALIEKLKNRV